MPFYEYHCSSCDMVWETQASMTEDYENPPKHCPKCDPKEDGEGTLTKYMGNCTPKFNLKGDGWFKGGMS
jgi:putative FmdB family regulatory protein